MDDRHNFDPGDWPEDLNELIKPELAPGERMLWAGRVKGRSSSGYAVSAIWAAGFLLISVVCFAAFLGALGPRLSRVEPSGPAGLLAGIIGLIILISMAGSWVSGTSGKSIVRQKSYALTD